MSVFDRTPLNQLAIDSKYFWDCCVVKKKRKDRFKEILKGNDDDKTCKTQPTHCRYWFITNELQKKYDTKRSEGHTGFRDTQIYFAKDVYQDFENNYCSSFHREWCIYEKYRDYLRNGIIELGRTLHALCHAPLELIQLRRVGLDLSHIKFFENLKIAETKKDEGAKKKLDEESKYILHNEQFMQHYFQLISLRDTISEEIKLQEKLTSTLFGWMGFFGSMLITLWLSSMSKDVYSILVRSFPIMGLEVNLMMILFIVLYFLFISSIIWYIWESIKLNEAKDVMYICLGVDVDNPEDRITCE
jgi:hypothetical protein